MNYDLNLVWFCIGIHPQACQLYLDLDLSLLDMFIIMFMWKSQFSNPSLAYDIGLKQECSLIGDFGIFYLSDSFSGYLTTLTIDTFRVSKWDDEYLMFKKKLVTVHNNKCFQLGWSKYWKRHFQLIHFIILNYQNTKCPLNGATTIYHMYLHY